MRTLDMSANPITEMQYYRENVFEKLTFLEALDGYDKDGSEWSLVPLKMTPSFILVLVIHFLK